ncbi:MAG: lytic transglycosylase domain-containing protein [Thermoplasmatales archaeon]
MKKTILTSLAVTNVVTVVLLLLGHFPAATTGHSTIMNSKVEELQAELKLLKEQEERDNLLGQYAINMMYETRAGKDLSSARKQVLARAIVRVVNDVFETPEHKKGFIAVLAIESEFKKFAQSPTGPKGLSQVAKAAFKEGMERCGVTDVHDDDVWETDINLYAGACYFRQLLETHNNDPFIAIVAYNQGPNSKDAKTYAKAGRAEAKESLQYIARFSFLKRKVSEDKAPNAPALSDLPVPGKNVKVDAGIITKSATNLTK